MQGAVTAPYQRCLVSAGLRNIMLPVPSLNIISLICALVKNTASAVHKETPDDWAISKGHEQWRILSTGDLSLTYFLPFTHCKQLKSR